MATKKTITSDPRLMKDTERAGADHFLAMIREIGEETERQVSAHLASVRDDDDGHDARDYAWVVDAIGNSLARSAATGARHHEGFLRGMADAFCCLADGCGVPVLETWDPIEITRQSFEGGEARRAPRQGAAHG